MEQYKKGVLISANIFYFFLFLGFVLFTHPNPTILNKYSLANVLMLLVTLVLAIPYNLLVLFLLNNALTLTYKKKKFRLHLGYRLLTVGFLLLFCFISLELTMRMMPKPFVENFHPFLQATNTEKNNASLHVNSHNFRYDEMTKEKPENTYRIFITGGSTVFDEWHPYHITLTKQVEDILRKKYKDKKIQVINAGYNRYTSEHTLILYQTKLIDYDPDLIVVWQGFNDMYYSCTPDYLTVGEYKNDYSHFINVLANVVNSYFNYQPKLFSLELTQRLFNEKFYADLKPFITTKPPPQPQYTDITFPSLQAYNRNMDYLVRAAKSDDVAVLIGNQPNYYLPKGKGFYGLAQTYCSKDGKIASPESLRKGMVMFNTASKALAEKHEVPFVDLEAKVPKTTKHFTDDVHYTVEGNTKVAEAVAAAIVENAFLENE